VSLISTEQNEGTINANKRVDDFFIFFYYKTLFETVRLYKTFRIIKSANDRISLHRSLVFSSFYTTQNHRLQLVLRTHVDAA